MQGGARPELLPGGRDRVCLTFGWDAPGLRRGPVLASVSLAAAQVASSHTRIRADVGCLGMENGTEICKKTVSKNHKKANSAALNESHLHFFSSLISEHYLRGRFVQFIYFGFLTVQGDNPQPYNFPPVPKSIKCTQKLISFLSSTEAQYLLESQ